MLNHAPPQSLSTIVTCEFTGLFLPTGLCGGSASGKTTVARKIIEALDVPWVVLLSMDSFYKVTRHIMEIIHAVNVPTDLFCIFVFAGVSFVATVLETGLMVLK